MLQNLYSSHNYGTSGPLQIPATALQSMPSSYYARL